MTTFCAIGIITVERLRFQGLSQWNHLEELLMLQDLCQELNCSDEADFGPLLTHHPERENYKHWLRGICLFVHQHFALIEES